MNSSSISKVLNVLDISAEVEIFQWIGSWRATNCGRACCDNVFGVFRSVLLLGTRFAMYFSSQRSHVALGKVNSGAEALFQILGEVK
jgi:hypothetical protein